MTPDEQLEQWCKGVSLHNHERDECCPDSSNKRLYNEKEKNTMTETIRERLMAVMLTKALPVLRREELGTRTNADLRHLISEIENITQPNELKPIIYKQDDWSLVEMDSEHWVYE